MNAQCTDCQARKANYDILRIISTISVMLIHVNWGYFGDNFDNYDGSIVWMIESLINIVTRFSIPCFLMISGAFILPNSRTCNARLFYKHVFLKIFMPTFILIIFLAIIKIIQLIFCGGDWTSFSLSLINGSFYNLWYMYMLLGIYAIAPVLAMIRNRLSVNSYLAGSIIFLIWAILSQNTSDQMVSWNIGVVVSYLSYFVLGDALKQTMDAKALKPGSYAMLGLIIILCISLSQLFRIYVSNYYSFRAYFAFLSPTIALLSVCVFIMFSKLNVKHDFSKISFLTFYAYVFHTIILEFCHGIIRNYNNNPIVNILIELVLVVLLSFSAALIFDLLWKRIKKVMIVDEI